MRAIVLQPVCGSEQTQLGRIQTERRPRVAVEGLMMAGMGVFGLLAIIVVVLVAPAAIKYLFFHKRR
jgi:type II secretory pathway component PulM